MDALKIADNSRNMEALRSARSFNDLIVTVSRILSSVTNMQSRLVKKAASAKKATFNLSEGQDGGIQYPTKELQSIHDILLALEVSEYEMKYARSTSGIITSADKLAKFNLVTHKLEKTLILTKRVAYKLLDELGQRYETPALRAMNMQALKVLRQVAPSARTYSFSFPLAEDRVNLVRYIVVRGLTTKGGYALSDYIIGLHAQNNFDDTFTYLLSFPVKINDKTAQQFPSSKRTIGQTIRDNMASSFNMRVIERVGVGTRRSVEIIPHVRSVRLESGKLMIALESGTTGKEINKVLTSVLPVLHAAFGVDDPRTDIMHRIETIDNVKTIVCAVSDRNFHDKHALDKLRSVTNMERSTFRELTRLMETNHAKI